MKVTQPFNIEILVSEVTPRNAEQKFVTVVDKLSKALKVPKDVIKPDDHSKGEQFRFVAEEELVDRWVHWFAAVSSMFYRGVCAMVGIPEHRVRVAKAIGPDDVAPMRHNGRIVYDATGQPLSKKQWDSIVAAMERFLNRNLKDKEKKIVLESAQLGRMLSRLSAKGINRKMELAHIEELEREWRRFDKLGPTARNVKDLLDLEPQQLWAFDIAQQQAGQLIRESGDRLKNGTRRVLIQATREKWPAQRVSQELYERMGDANRDWRRVAETEIVDTMNLAFVRDQVSLAKPGEKVYFQRHEILDAHTCGFCTKINRTIALFVEEPLQDDKIDDPIAKVAIWPGKSNIGRKQAKWWIPMGPVHPHCRGSWEQYAAGDGEDEIDRMIAAGRAKLDEASRRWGEGESGDA